MKVKLENVILSFPELFHHAKYQGQSTGKYAGTFLFDKSNTALKDKIDKAIAKVVAEHPSGISLKDIKKDKLCIRDGDDETYEGYADRWSVKASNGTRPTLINQRKEPVVEEDNLFYAGCRVNALINLWVQNNGYGKRVNANLLGVQFVGNGERLEATKVAGIDDFDEVEDVDSDDIDL